MFCSSSCLFRYQLAYQLHQSMPWLKFSFLWLPWLQIQLNSCTGRSIYCKLDVKTTLMTYKNLSGTLWTQLLDISFWEISRFTIHCVIGYLVRLLKFTTDITIYSRFDRSDSGDSSFWSWPQHYEEPVYGNYSDATAAILKATKSESDYEDNSEDSENLD